MAISTCCEVMDCVTIYSSDNSVTLQKKDCGYNITFSGNNVDSRIKINESEGIKWTKEFIDGVLVLTPTLDFEAIADRVCVICSEKAGCATTTGVTLETL